MLLTLAALDGTTGVGGAPPPPVTVIAPSASHPAPPSPHDLTCKVCARAEVERLAFIVVPLTPTVAPLLIHYAINPTASEEQVEPLPSRVNGEANEAPLPGLLTVMPTVPPLLVPEPAAVIATSASHPAPPF